MATLTTKKRRTLPPSAFCGPNRSFPVTDCNHVRAGLSLLGRYQGSDKDGIRACIYRRAKRLGCFKTKEAIPWELEESLALYQQGKLDALDFSAVIIAHAPQRIRDGAWNLLGAGHLVRAYALVVYSLRD